jgi:hypothetical protein
MQVVLVVSVDGGHPRVQALTMSVGEPYRPTATPLDDIKAYVTQTAQLARAATEHAAPMACGRGVPKVAYAT